MNVKLTSHSEKLLREYLARGPYHTPEEVIEHALESLEEAEPSQPPHERATLEQFLASLDALAEGSEKIPTLPSSAFSRESIYQDHD
jgi:Arc/MetJ-type ribon-helix-helix transcriptional regulator